MSRRFRHRRSSCWPGWPSPRAEAVRIAHLPRPPPRWPSVIPLDRSPRGGTPGGCGLPPSREVSCGDPDPAFYDEMASAVEEVLETKAELFDLTDVNRGTGWPRVKDMAAYHQAVIDILVRKGYCALFDGEEIQLKRTNEFSEHYDVNYADKYIRTGPGTFRGSCYPAAF